MDYEKKYKEALSRAKQFSEKPLLEDSASIVEYIFPELKESEDDKMVEDIIYSLNQYMSCINNAEHLRPSDKKYWTENVMKQIAWLEKQGERKHTDKVESKFKVGDWITNGTCIIKITSVDERYYWHDNDCVGGDIESINKEYHLWTIQDAMDGDVLAYGDNPNDWHVEITMIFKSVRNEKSAFTHFHFFDDKFRVNDWCDCGKNAHPATKEQRDTLIKKMHEAGYDWLSEERKLIKIAQ